MTFPIWQNILGTLSQTFKIGGKNGVTLGNNSGQLTVNGSPLTSGVQMKIVDVAFNSSATINTINLPIGSSIIDARLYVDTVFDGTPTLSVGVSGDTSKYVSTSDIDLTSAGAYPVITNPLAATTEESVIISYSSGSATAGSARLLLVYGVG